MDTVSVMLIVILIISLVGLLSTITELIIRCHALNVQKKRFREEEALLLQV